MFADYETRAASGNFLKVPLFIGTTQNEGDIFIVAQEEVSLGFTVPVVTQTLSDYLTQASATCLCLGSLSLTPSKQFTCSISKTSNDRVKAGVPTWRYQYQGNCMKWHIIP